MIHQENLATNPSMVSKNNVLALNSANSFGSSVFNIFDIFRVLRRWWWLIAAFVILSVIVTGYFVSRMDPVYQASSILEIKQQERKIFDQNSEVEDFIVDNEFFNTQIELLKSSTLAGNIVDQFNLTSDPEFSILEGTRDQRRRAAIKRFSGRLNVGAIGRSRLIKVSFQHGNPVRAARIANAATESFVTYNLERKYNSTSYARDFIEDRLKTTKQVLESSERDLVAYASDNNLVTVKDEQGNVSPGFLASESIIALNKELLGARTKRIELEKKFDIAASADVPVSVSGGRVLADLRRTHTELTAEYMEKRATFVPDFPPMKELQARIDYIAEQIESETTFLEGQGLSTLKADYDIALGTEQDILNRFNALKNSFEDIRDKSVEYNILKREVDTNRSQYDALLQRLKEVSIADDIGSNLISLVDRAETPSRPIRPRVMLSILMAAILSSLLGTGLVFFREFIDDRIKTPDDVKNKLGHVVMGVIPWAKNIRKSGKGNTRDLSDGGRGLKDITTVLSNPTSAVAEAYSSLRTNLQFSGPDGGPRVIHITSTRSGEGKSVSSLGLALRFAGLGDKVLLIDADMRLPTFKHGVEESAGLSGLLTSRDNIDDNILKTAYDNLYILPSGANVPNPSEILSTYRLGEIIEYVKSRFSYVIVDSPPVMGLADASILASNCDASLLVVEGASTRTPSVKATLERLVVGGIKVLGIVITKYSQQSKGYYSYYQYNYGAGSTSYSTASKGKKSQSSIKKDYMDIMTKK